MSPVIAGLPRLGGSVGVALAALTAPTSSLGSALPKRRLLFT
ncbi:MAG: hypothetical protein Q4G67_10630 [Actinomycetia bacterium]|nr:hypothetical protein [Actinomycetes bacterium]